MAKRKFDYDGDEFYDALEKLAMRGYTVQEAAYGLEEFFGVFLNPTSLDDMKNGTYSGWTPEENKKYGQRISEAWARGQAKILGLVRGRYLKAALGGIKIKGRSTRKRHLVVDGKQTDDLVVEETETEQETPPNIGALGRWLYQNDPEWRKVQRGTEDENLPFDPKKGVSIRAWIQKEIDADKDA